MNGNVMKFNKKGFTLLELVVVIAILSILAAVIFPNLPSYTVEADDAVVKTNLRSFYNGVAAVDRFEDIDFPLNNDDITIGASKEFLEKAAEYSNVKNNTELSKFKAFKVNRGIYVEYHHKNGKIYKYPDFNNKDIVVGDNLDDKGCPTNGYIPVDLKEYLDFTIGGGTELEIKLGDFIEFEGSVEVYTNDGLVYLNLEFSDTQLFSEIHNVDKTLTILDSIMTSEDFTLPNMLPLELKDFSITMLVEQGDYRKFGELNQPKYYPIYNDSHLIEECILNDIIESKPKYCYNFIGEVVTEYFGTDEVEYFLTNKNKLYKVDTNEPELHLEISSNVVKASFDIDLVYEFNNNIYKYDGNTSIKLMSGTLKEHYNQYVLSKEGLLYDLRTNSLTAGVRSILKDNNGKSEENSSYNRGYVKEDGSLITGYSEIPTKVGNVTLNYSTGNNATNFIVSDKRLYAWGLDNNGSYGNGVSNGIYNDELYEVPLPNDVEIQKILSYDGNGYSSNTAIFALATNGDLYYWGVENNYGGSNTTILTPRIYATNVKDFMRRNSSDKKGLLTILYKDGNVNYVNLVNNKFTQTNVIDNIREIKYNNSGGPITHIMETNNNELHVYYHGFKRKSNPILNVKDYRIIQGDFYVASLDNKYFKVSIPNVEPIETSITQDEYNSYLGRVLLTNNAATEKHTLGVYKDKICIEKIEYGTNN